MSQMVTDVFDTVATTISSLFSSPDVSEGAKEESAETEKSPPAEQEPAISVSDIIGSLGTDREE